MQKEVLCWLVLLLPTTTPATSSFPPEDTALSGEHPYMVLLQATGQVVCSGSIISRSWVLTAGHCLPEDVLPGQCHLTAGVVRTRHVATHAQTRRGRRIVRHPRYVMGTSTYDLALVKVNRPFTFDMHVDKVGLSADPPVFLYSSECFCLGFGVAGNGSVMQGTLYRLRIRSSWVCSDNVDKKQNLLVCSWSGTTSDDSYLGDSGGPMVRDGVLSAVMTAGQKLLGFEFQVHTAVVSFVCWIRRHVRDAEFYSRYFFGGWELKTIDCRL